jgi:selenocysteine lyase/cysteine desulfurase
MLTSESRQQFFPSLEGMTYLNTAAEGVPPLPVAEALAQYFQDKQLGMDGRERHFAQWEAARALAAPWFGLTAAEVGICSCTSEAYNLAALALRLQPGDEVIINDLDFPSGVTPWLQPTCPATVKVWRAREGGLRVEDLVPLLGPRTRLVTVSLVSFYNGFMIPLPAVVEAVRKHSPALLALDVTQALGRVPLRLDGVDLVVSSTHKWILASHGGGLVGVPEARAQEWTVPAGGWFNLQDPFGPDRFERAVSQPGAAGFMVGMPNFPAVYAIRAALEYLQGVGVEAIEQAARPLVSACLAELKKLPVEVLTPDEEEALAGIVAFRHPAAEAIHASLRAEDIHIMAHAGRLRVSLHGYNTLADVERFLQKLQEALHDVGSL